MGITIGWLDVVIIAAYLALLGGMGICFSRRQENLLDFFLARKGMSWVPIGLSLMAALNSGIDYLAQPAATIKFGLVILATNLSWLVLYPYVFFVTLPMFRSLEVYSAYEYLERRFHLAVRGLGAVIFLLWRLSWMATALYVPCLVLTSAIGRKELLVPAIVTLGALVTFYTMLGGIKAVVWADVMQFCIMMAGLSGTVIVAWASVPGGWREIVAATHEVGAVDRIVSQPGSAGVLAGITSFFATPVSAVGLVIAAVVARLGTYTSDQVMVQRFQTARSVREARKGFLITACSDVIWMTALALVGVGLFAYFRHHSLPEFVVENPDRIFPYFMGQVFPTGLVGLTFAAILAASLSSSDSALNSLTSVCMVDLYNRIYLGRTTADGDLTDFQKRRQHRLLRAIAALFGGLGLWACLGLSLENLPSLAAAAVRGVGLVVALGGVALALWPAPWVAARKAVFVSRVFTLIAGILGTALSCHVERLGSIFEIAIKLINGFTGPLLAIFLLGMFTRRANAAGAFLGGAAGTVTTLYTVYLSSLERPVVSFLWPASFGLATALAVGYIASAIVNVLARPSEARLASQAAWRFTAVMARNRDRAEDSSQVPMN